MSDDAATTITLRAIESPNIDVVTYRGSAPLGVLTKLSQTDTYDQDDNPEGLQRDLSRKHAFDAYDYAAAEPDKDQPRAFPEVFLNVRDKRAVQVTGGGDDIVTLTFDVDRIASALKRRKVAISRVDGNHRLAFGAGDGRERGELDVMVPFSITIGLPPKQEAGLFLDYNSEHKGLNSSHLHTLRSSLTPDDREYAQHPERVFARQLAADEGSPWNGLVHMGGSKAGAKERGITRPVTFVALESGIKRILRGDELEVVTNPDQKYELVRRYWQAVRLALPAAFETPGDFMVTKNIGIQVLGTFGSRVLSRLLVRGQTEVDQIQAEVEKGMAALDWSTDGDLSGMSGNRAALQLAARMVDALSSE